MTFEDIEKDKFAKEMLLLTIRRIEYINWARVLTNDEIIKEFIHLLDVGGFKIKQKDSKCHHNHIGGEQGCQCLDCGKTLMDDDPQGF